MQIVDGELVVSPTDLTRFLACRHLTALDHAVARGELAPPDVDDEPLEALFRRGLEHERSHLERLRRQGRRVAEIEPAGFGPGSAGLRAAEQATVAAMATGADVVYQATFFDGAWRGHADFLLRRDDRPGRWAWSYDVADTKLARRLAVPAVLQMAAYAERLAVLQGVPPEELVVVDGAGVERPFPFSDCAEYARLVRAELLAFLRDRPATRPEPVRHCGRCRWQERCHSRWRADDDLSLVAGMRGRQAESLRRTGIDTVARLAATPPEGAAATLGAAAAERLTRQARLQVAARESGHPGYVLLEPRPVRGLALLPEPSPGDVFFDMEGDPFVGPDGLEYLFGVVDAGGFTPYWALDRRDEKAAFEALVDHVLRAWDQDPGMHVYHYAPYEPSRLKALSGRYDTRGAEVDRLLRGGRLVDLYAVVKQGLQVGTESYSLKKLEPFYWGHLRTGDGVQDALGSVVAFERWLVERDDALLEQIRAYNEEDCRSTRALRDWLEELRADAGGDGRFARPVPGDGAPSEQVARLADETAALRAALWAGLPDDAPRWSAQQRATWLLGALLDWHRRQARPQWWEYFDRLGRTDAELQVEGTALAGLSPAEHVGTVKRSSLWRMTFPPQDTSVTPGTRWVDPATEQQVRIRDVDAADGWVVVARSATGSAPGLTALVPGGPVPTPAHRDRLHELGRWVATHGVDSSLPPWRAARDLLLRHPPRLHDGAVCADVDDGAGSLVAPGESASDAVRRLVPRLAGGVLAVQGPPGTGKTRTAAHAVVDLVAAGRRVGICAFSHKAVGTLLDAVCAAARERAVPVRALQKAEEAEAGASDEVPSTTSNGDVDAALAAGDAEVVAGTTWLFARPELAGTLDVLVVDEAGQLSLADVLAVSHAAESVVLLGDPQQLTQPVTGVHPPGAGVSALEHLLDGHPTVPPGRGVLLDTTYRMHPAVATFVSELAYEGRLGVAAGLDRQRVDAPGSAGAGLLWVPVEHNGCTTASTEEAEVVRQLVAGLLAGATRTDASGATAALRPEDLLVLAPYNQQVNRVRRALADVPGGADVVVGTVDRLQGREATAVVYTLATSSADEASRGVDFLLDVHRLTVAVSRARALVVVVGSPALLLTPTSTPEGLRRVNGLCTYAARARRLAVGAPRRMARSLAGT